MSEHGKERGLFDKGTVSRREFLKVAGVAGASIGALGGLGGLVAACGGTAATTTTAAAATTTTAAAGGTTTTAGAGTTTTTASVETGRAIKLGLVYPKTGALSSFAKPDEWIVDTFKKDVKDGVVCGDGKLHTFDVLLEDSQSSASRASQVAGDMILNSKVDMLLASSSPDNANPVADQAETNGVPMLATFVPWQPFYNRAGKPPAQPYTWTWMYHFGLEDAAQVRMALWAQLDTNKKVGLLFPNDADGSAWANEKTGFTPKVVAAGYAVTQPGLHDTTAEDFTQQISEYKKNACEIISGIETPPLFTNFWKQAIQQGLHPTVCTMGKALLFHETLVALKDSGIGLSDEVVWHPTFPYKSSLSGLTCQQFADLYTSETGNGWTEPLGQYGKYEWAVDIYKRMTDIEDKSQFPKVVAATKFEGLQGPVDFTLPVDPKNAHPVLNVFKIRIAAGQWVKTDGTGKWPYDLVLCAANGDEIPTPAKMLPISYA
jgi:branched-chain amino acid transport system substrate-binding protein